MIVCMCVQYDGVNHLSDDLSHLGEVLPPHDLEESGLPSLADLSTTDLKYQSYSMKGLGNAGCSLRYFSIQPVLAVSYQHSGARCADTNSLGCFLLFFFVASRHTCGAC